MMKRITKLLLLLSVCCMTGIQALLATTSDQEKYAFLPREHIPSEIKVYRIYT